VFPCTFLNVCDSGLHRFLLPARTYAFQKRTSTKTAANEPLADDAVPEGKPDTVRRGRKRAVPAANGTAGDGAATGRRKRQKVVPRVEESSGLSSVEDE
jgi:hypothetical protein